MGTTGLTRKRSLQKFFPNFKRQDWYQVPPQQLQGRSKFGDLTTLRNKTTRQQIDRYELAFFSDRQQRIYEQCFLQRLREEYLVNAFHYQALKSPSVCSNVRGAVIYIQHIPIRLSDVTDIPFDQSLYIIKSALLGFEKLYNQSGYFQVMEQHIGIDKQGQIKVWLNADLSKNYPYSHDQDSHQSRDYQRIMVGQIINLIQKNTNFQQSQVNISKSGYVPLTAFMQRKNIRHPSFMQVQQIINQYIKQYKVQLPKRCSSVIEIFQQQYGEQFNVTSASDFLDHIDVGQNQLFQQQLQKNASMQDQTIQMMSSRVENLQNKLNNQRTGSEVMESRNKGQQSQSISMPYREYQPISMYKPNDKNKRISVAQQSNRGSRLSSNANGRVSQMHKPRATYKNSKTHSKQSSIHQSNRHSHSTHQNMYVDPQRPYRGSGLYAQRPSTNQVMYMQIGDDLDRLYGQKSSQADKNSQLNRSQSQSQNSQVERSRSSQQLRESNASRSSHCSSSMSSRSYSDKIIQVPKSYQSGGVKITFSYAGMSNNINNSNSNANNNSYNNENNINQIKFAPTKPYKPSVPHHQHIQQVQQSNLSVSSNRQVSSFGHRDDGSTHGRGHSQHYERSNNGSNRNSQNSNDQHHHYHHHNQSRHMYHDSQDIITDNRAFQHSSHPENIAQSVNQSYNTVQVRNNQDKKIDQQKIDQQKIDKEFRRDIQKQMKKDSQDKNINNNNNNNKIVKDSKGKYQVKYEDKIYECECEEDIDSEIMKDLLKETNLAY